MGERDRAAAEHGTAVRGHEHGHAAADADADRQPGALRSSGLFSIFFSHSVFSTPYAFSFFFASFLFWWLPSWPPTYPCFSCVCKQPICRGVDHIASRVMGEIVGYSGIDRGERERRVAPKCHPITARSGPEAAPKQPPLAPPPAPPPKKNLTTHVDPGIRCTHVLRTWYSTYAAAV